MDDESSFLGRGWSFPPRFDKDLKGIRMVAAEEDIRESLHILFSTVPGERMMLPQYGCNVREFLFQNMDTSLGYYLKETIGNAILQYEPRIQVNNMELDTTNVQDGLILLSLDYTIRTTNTRSNMVFPFYYAEGTLLKT